MDSQSGDGFFTQFLNNQNCNNDFVMNTPTLNQGVNSQSSQSAIKKSRGDNFTHKEDILIVNAWLSTSLDPIVGNDQKSQHFWIRVHSCYHECKKPNLQERTSGSLMNRWSTMQRSVNKYCGCLAQIESLHPSGHSEAHKIKMAKIAYTDTFKKIFKYEHCWEILRYQPKWILHKETVNAKKNRGANDRSFIPQTITLEDEDVCATTTAYCERPPGKKAQKENEKKRKFNEEKAAQFENVISSLREERRKCHDEKMKKIEILTKIEEMKVAQKERLVAIAEKRREQEEKEKIDHLMMMDISRLDDVQQEYIKNRRLEIVHNMKTS